MKPLQKIVLAVAVVCLMMPFALHAKEQPAKLEMSDEKLLEMVDITLQSLPQKAEKIDPRIRRIAFYTLRVDRSSVSLPLLKQIYGKIEASFLQIKRPMIIYSPEVKPFKIVSNENAISFTSGFQSTQEIKDISQKLKLDGFLEGELYVTNKTIFLNLRIFESEDMSVVWSEELTSILPPEPPAPLIQRTSGIDYGLGLSGIPVSAGKNVDPSLQIPSYAQFYNFDVRLAQRSLANDRLMFTIAGGLLGLYEGVTSDTLTLDPTMVSTTGSGVGVKFFGRVGFRVSLFQMSKKEATPKGSEVKEAPAVRDLLAAELTYGRLFGVGSSGISTFGIAFETDITKIFSMRAGINFTPVTDLTVATDNEIKAGGLSYEISLLRFNYKP